MGKGALHQIGSLVTWWNLITSAKISSQVTYFLVASGAASDNSRFLGVGTWGRLGTQAGVFLCESYMRGRIRAERA